MLRSGVGKRHTYGGNVLRPVVKKQTGYRCVSLHRAGMKPVQVSVHRLVLETFVGQPKDGQQACHNNGIRSDNRLTNLRWDSVAGNMLDKKRHGTQPIGAGVHNSKLSEEKVRLIRESTELQDVLARRYGVTQVAISRIKLRKMWKHVA